MATGVDTEATDMARGLLMLRLSPATVATAMAAMVATDMAVDTTARGLLMPSLRLRPRLSPAVATTARGLLMPSLRLMPLLRLSPVMVMAVAMAVMAVDTVAMVATGATAMVATARGLLSLAMATTGATAAMVATATAGATATGVSYHRIRRSELSQKQ